MQEESKRQLRAQQKKILKKWFRKDNLILVILAGILLFVIALPTKEASPKTGRGSGLLGMEKEEEHGEMTENTANVLEGADGDWENYVSKQESRFKDMLSRMAGVGKVDVMLTISSSEELVVEKDSPTVRSNTNEEDSEGGRRIVTQLNIGETTVYRTAGGESEPYVIKTLKPQIEGVLVVAQGAGTGTVNKDITEIAQALFGVDAHKVKVVRMEIKEDGS